jgi:hypothetical protein
MQQNVTPRGGASYARQNSHLGRENGFHVGQMSIIAKESC